MAVENKQTFDVEAFLNTGDGGRTISTYQINEAIFSQGDAADAVFYIQKGKVKVTVVSDQGKEAIVAMLGQGEFVGENCLTGLPRRIATITLAQSVPVKETFGSKSVWEGVVHAFKIHGYPKANQAYAWSSPIEGSDKRRFFAVMHLPPITSPAEAVRAAIVAEQRAKQ
jgi:Cyclic nucleotide-binding domain